MIRGGDRGIHVGPGRFLEDADHIPRIGRITIFKCLPGRAINPLAVDEILINLGLLAAADDGRRGQSLGRHEAS
jgi:hypothetical protein